MINGCSTHLSVTKLFAYHICNHVYKVFGHKIMKKVQYANAWLVNATGVANTYIHSKNKLVTLVADKLMRQRLCIVYFANCIRQPGRKLPRQSTTGSCRYSNHWLCIFERSHSCMLHAISCRENHHKSIIFLKCSCSHSLTDVLRVVSCKEWFGVGFLMQLNSNTKINFS